MDKDGKIVTEEKEIEIPMFRPVKVFDVSQTDGKPLPELASSLSGNVPNYEAFMEALRRSAPVPITFEAMAADTDGYFSADHQKIAIRQGMSEVQTVSATVHEIAHSKLHNQKKIQIANGYVVKLELPELKELVSLMRRSSNNLNQLTRKVHETGRVYNADLEDISQRQEQLWEGVKEILTQLSKLS